ncbi:hypothetical protein CEUSTIGMA_g11366.t1 [Chlamydomonas eustigma]|uniref:Pyruvate phosphate dikinase AMP/ATP-binding domain-containing protein n=1 Tax=Chlamydomonas eustigma TaxID=1157962 RepID=A0A250XM25_9CHLO|nr:hypothetical protein CEUSTIGMA_g11366.t1 [Chlamydomonas eustigma]|eukprot:GAX83942.1 hypothetical protein CEUSTIGMA_g11366.t1 [Chlamydomonas eustigma]
MIPRRNEQSSSGILSSSSLNMIYPFMNGRSDGKKEMKALLGGKGANLCEMARCGLNVPPGFTITTEVCQYFYRNGQKLPDAVLAGIRASVGLLEESTGQRFGGSPDNVLLLSVRSGAAVSMPGMMDTVLNLGLNDSLVEGLAKQRGQRFAYDCYRRLLQMFGDVVLGIPNEEFESCLRMVRSRTGAKLDVELQEQDLKEVIQQYKQVYTKHNQTLPIDPWDQLYMGIDAVFRYSISCCVMF